MKKSVLAESDDKRTIFGSDGFANNYERQLMAFEPDARINIGC